MLIKCPKCSWPISHYIKPDWTLTHTLVTVTVKQYNGTSQKTVGTSGQRNILYTFITFAYILFIYFPALYIQGALIKQGIWNSVCFALNLLSLSIFTSFYTSYWYLHKIEVNLVVLSRIDFQRFKWYQRYYFGFS